MTENKIHRTKQKCIYDRSSTIPLTFGRHVRLLRGRGKADAPELLQVAGVGHEVVVPAHGDVRGVQVHAKSIYELRDADLHGIVRSNRVHRKVGRDAVVSGAWRQRRVTGEVVARERSRRSYKSWGRRTCGRR